MDKTATHKSYGFQGCYGSQIFNGFHSADGFAIVFWFSMLIMARKEVVGCSFILASQAQLGFNSFLMARSRSLVFITTRAY